MVRAPDGLGVNWVMLMNTPFKSGLETFRSPARRSAPRRPVVEREFRLSPASSHDLHYYGIAPPPRLSWLAILISASLHAGLLLGFGRHVPVHRVVVHDDPVEQMQMMPLLEEPEDPKPRELDDDQADAPPSVAVPMLADIPSLVILDSSFVQQLDLTVPLKADPNAGNILSIPVNIQRGRLDERGLKNLFNMSELDRRPEPTVQMAPNYPFEMNRQGITGRVVLRFIVDSSGNVIRPAIVSSSNSGFERAALEAILKWRFRPGIKSGRKVNTRVEQPMDFSIADKGS